ncbi:MAG: hypothetical protein AAFU79_37640 [Myxococcota bacterium]
MRLTAWVAIAALFTGCDDDVLNMQRADIGVRDAGAMDPLGLQVATPSFAFPVSRKVNRAW